MIVDGADSAAEEPVISDGRVLPVAWFLIAAANSPVSN